MTQSAAERMEFKTEVSQLLDLVVHSLYSHKDIFLRELISNASDAIDKLRYLSITDAELAGGQTAWRIKLSADKVARTLTISDNGIGMTRDELATNLGTIAKSGTKEFLAALQQAKDNVNLIGQFGVGFYSAFMVADKVTVLTKSPKSEGFSWTSDGKQGFDIAPVEKAERGTDVILHLKEDAGNYLEEYELRTLVKKYSDFVEFPVVMDVERSETPRDEKGEPVKDAQPVTTVKTETLNSQKAIWSKNKSEVTAEEYKEFYQHLSHDFSEPLEIVHYRAEGTIEFKALIFIPTLAPMDLFTKEGQRGLQLYINRVFIMSDAKNLIPPYLRFLKGVVDTSDLPLNVSREILQQNAQLDKIRKNLVTKILAVLKEMKEKDYEKYQKFYRTFGAVLKEGLHYDHDQHEAIAGLLLFESTTAEPGVYRSLDQYVADMKPEQKTIYYLAAEDRAQALAAPRLEAYKSKGWEVLLFLEPIDEIVMPDLYEYKQKPLRSVNQGDMDATDDEKKQLEAEIKQAGETYKDLLAYMGKKLESDVAEVRFSPRLTESPAALISEDFGMNKSMREMWKAMGRELPPQKFILELNPKHPLIASLAALEKKSPLSGQLEDTLFLLYDQAQLAAGHKLKDVAAFTRRLNQLLLQTGAA
ncbi:MAG: molecular chaperone HtpG [Candidatus Firestonebacteria bacterium]|nr:molecular chaperone HtpG [Candidatus Firestonebacteria bacterium]